MESFDDIAVRAVDHANQLLDLWPESSSYSQVKSSSCDSRLDLLRAPLHPVDQSVGEEGEDLLLDLGEQHSLHSPKPALVDLLRNDQICPGLGVALLLLLPLRVDLALPSSLGGRCLRVGETPRSSLLRADNLLLGGAEPALSVRGELGEHGFVFATEFEREVGGGVSGGSVDEGRGSLVWRGSAFHVA